MKLLRRILDKQARHFEPGGRFERFYPLYEAPDTFLYTPGKTTAGAAHVRDALDLKRLMMTVVVALVPCMLMAMWNTGRQIHLAVGGGAAPLANWRTDAMEMMGLSFDASSLLANTVHGALYYVPVLVVTFAVGGAWEGLFAVVRRHDVNEGFLVTGMLFPLVLPPTIPLWQVAVGISFGVVVGTRRSRRGSSCSSPTPPRSRATPCGSRPARRPTATAAPPRSARSRCSRPPRVPTHRWTD